MTTTFDAALHPRGAAGKFTEATHPEDPGTTLDTSSAVADRMYEEISGALGWDVNVSDRSTGDWDHTQEDFSPLSEDMELMASIGEAAAAAIQAGDGLGEKDLRNSVADAIAEQCGEEVTVCTRVWEAWSYGTMGPDDFQPLSEDDGLLADMATAAIKGYRGEQE